MSHSPAFFETPRPPRQHIWIASQLATVAELADPVGNEPVSRAASALVRFFSRCVADRRVNLRLPSVRRLTTLTTALAVAVVEAGRDTVELRVDGEPVNVPSAVARHFNRLESAAMAAPTLDALRLQLARNVPQAATPTAEEPQTGCTQCSANLVDSAWLTHIATRVVCGAPAFVLVAQCHSCGAAWEGVLPLGAMELQPKGDSNEQ